MNWCRNGKYLSGGFTWSSQQRWGIATGKYLLVANRNMFSWRITSFQLFYTFKKLNFPPGTQQVVYFSALSTSQIWEWNPNNWSCKPQVRQQPFHRTNYWGIIQLAAWLPPWAHINMQAGLQPHSPLFWELEKNHHAQFLIFFIFSRHKAFTAPLFPTSPTP